MIDQLLYHYLARLHSQRRVQGRILNVGLGSGLSAQLMLDKRGVQALVTLERSQEAIDRYRLTYSTHPYEQFHKIVLGDAADLAAVRDQLEAPFDFVYVDTIEDFKDNHYDDLRRFCVSLKTLALLKPSGVLMIEYQADVPIEREFRNHWVKQHYQEVMERQALNPSAGGRAQQMLYYRLPS